MSKIGKPCLFCGRWGSKSREHIFPRWMKGSVQSIHETTFHQTTNFDYPNNVANIGYGLLKRPGRSLDQTLRVVCRPCNNGWMSRLQNQVKPILLPFVRGAPSLEKMINYHCAVSRWCAMSDIVSEATDETTKTSSPDERRWIMENESAPPNWTFWIGQLKEEAAEPTHCRSALSFTGDDSDKIFYRHVDFVVAGHLAYVSASGLDNDLPALKKLDNLLSSMSPLSKKMPFRSIKPMSNEREFIDKWRDWRFRHLLGAL
ncbi:hypothetical protein ACTOV4_01070 [Brucella sp. C7-11G]